MYDYLIVGQGLAGTILSHQLIKAGYSVYVINDYNPGCASYVAAGIFSPIAGQRIAKIENAATVIQDAYATYQELETLLNIRCFQEMPYVKLAVDEKLDYYMQKRIADPRYKEFITPVHHDIHGKKLDGIIIKNTGYVDTKNLLDAYRTYLIAHTMYRQERFDDAKLIVNSDHVVYGDIQAGRIIFCNGLTANKNRFFNDLQFNPTKGELLTIKMEITMDYIVSGNLFVLPLGNNLFHVGATYERNYQSELPSSEGLAWLKAELEKIIDIPYEIIEHKAGIRPTTFGHRPFIAWHKIHHNVGVFSGFGSKGVSIIPYYAQLFLYH